MASPTEPQDAEKQQAPDAEQAPPNSETQPAPVNSETPAPNAETKADAAITDIVDQHAETLPPLSTADIRAIAVVAERVRGLLRNTVDNLIEIGRELNAIRPRIPHGKWENFLNDELGLSQPSAYRLMRIAKAFESFPRNDLRAFDRHAMYLLSAPDVTESTRAEAVDRAAAGEHISLDVARAITGKSFKGQDREGQDLDDDGDDDTDTDTKADNAGVEGNADGTTKALQDADTGVGLWPEIGTPTADALEGRTADQTQNGAGAGGHPEGDGGEGREDREDDEPGGQAQADLDSAAIADEPNVTGLEKEHRESPTPAASGITPDAETKASEPLLPKPEPEEPDEPEPEEPDEPERDEPDETERDEPDEPGPEAIKEFVEQANSTVTWLRTSAKRFPTKRRRWEMIQFNLDTAATFLEDIVSELNPL
jgi:hypothetical protein